MVLFAKFVAKEKAKVIYLVDLTKTEGTLMTYIKTVTNCFFSFCHKPLENFQISKCFLYGVNTYFYSQLLHFHALCFLWLRPGNSGDNWIYKKK